MTRRVELALIAGMILLIGLILAAPFIVSTPEPFIETILS